ncbi:MAG TPA: hypothetical protein EYN67_05060 [Flavobacteriales bacterium]|nr:hypothetical protein [Flavobacteriales bacterium]
MKIGDLVKATPLPKWDVDDGGYTQIGIVTRIGFDTLDVINKVRDPDGIILLNFGDDDGIFRTSDWHFEVISENR